MIGVDDVDTFGAVQASANFDTVAGVIWSSAVWLRVPARSLPYIGQSPPPPASTMHGPAARAALGATSQPTASAAAAIFDLTFVLIVLSLVYIWGACPSLALAAATHTGSVADWHSYKRTSRYQNRPQSVSGR